ncbi:MAG TPA: hypothetical protein VMT35_12165 [Ignavibacteriaceae bacterium]|nr:hypothetical protein [Ignavibacteriaceae bacterium]
MKNSLAAVIFSIILLHGCENVDVVQTKIEYKEKIVVSAELVSESLFSGVTFTRTLPIGERYDIKKAEIVNVDSYLRINFIRIVPLHYQADGVYKPASNLMVNPGDIFELFGKVNGKAFYSKTLIPGKISISNAVLEAGYIRASIIPKEGEVYGCKWFVYSSAAKETIAVADEFFSIIEPSELNTSGSLTVRTSQIPDLYLSAVYLDMINIQVCAFDKAYMNYYLTRSNQNVVNNPFTQGGEEIVWNVYGDDAIGMFIGMGKSTIKAVRQ